MFSTSSSSNNWPSVPHYYGDVSRQCLLGAVALLLLASPLYGDNVRIEFPFEIAGALVIVAFAAFTNPHLRWACMGDAAVSGAGLALYAGWAFFEYDSISPLALVLRLAIALIFLFAFYFSMKTVRSFALHQIGRREEIDEFNTEEERAEQEAYEREDLLQHLTSEEKPDPPPGQQRSGNVN